MDARRSVNDMLAKVKVAILTGSPDCAIEVELGQAMTGEYTWEFE